MIKFSYMDERIKRHHGQSQISQRNDRRLREINTEENGSNGRRHLLYSG